VVKLSKSQAWHFVVKYKHRFNTVPIIGPQFNDFAVVLSYLCSYVQQVIIYRLRR
jgi:hypothetical protein